MKPPYTRASLRCPCAPRPARADAQRSRVKKTTDAPTATATAPTNAIRRPRLHLQSLSSAVGAGVLAVARALVMDRSGCDVSRGAAFERRSSLGRGMTQSPLDRAAARLGSPCLDSTGTPVDGTGISRAPPVASGKARRQVQVPACERVKRPHWGQRAVRATAVGRLGALRSASKTSDRRH